MVIDEAGGKKSRRLVCSHHSCKVKTDLVECEHCGKLFCSEHLEPRLPYLPNFESNTQEAKKAIEAWRKPGGHACPPYYDYLKVKEKEEMERRWQALNKMRGLPVRKEHRIPILDIPSSEEPRPRKRNRVIILIAIIVIVVFLLVYLMMMNLGSIFTKA